jgi:lipopolysaccharide/colanic/teichoic acid biosynthesis glycosyltransferase
MTLVPDYHEFDEFGRDASPLGSLAHKSLGYRVGKRVFDLGFTTILLLPATIIVGFCLLALNPFYNPGPLFYRQKRMGRDCVPFRALKFRSMTTIGRVKRGPDDPLETHRITPLGGFLRRSRFDELPQILNVYRGEMSLIGPRPDALRYAHHYMRLIPGYRERHVVRPGISGLSQIELGYAEALNATRRKTESDIDYIKRASFALDLWIFVQTIRAVVRMRGS